MCYTVLNGGKGLTIVIYFGYYRFSNPSWILSKSYNCCIHSKYEDSQVEPITVASSTSEKSRILFT